VICGKPSQHPIGGELHPGVLPGQVDQVGVAVHLGVRGTPGGRPGGLPVIVPGPDRSSWSIAAARAFICSADGVPTAPWIIPWRMSRRWPAVGPYPVSM